MLPIATPFQKPLIRLTSSHGERQELPFVIEGEHLPALAVAGELHTAVPAEVMVRGDATDVAPQAVRAGHRIPPPMTGSLMDSAPRRCSAPDPRPRPRSAPRRPRSSAGPRRGIPDP